MDVVGYRYQVRFCNLMPLDKGERSAIHGSRISHAGYIASWETKFRHIKTWIPDGGPKSLLAKLWFNLKKSYGLHTCSWVLVLAVHSYFYKDFF